MLGSALSGAYLSPVVTTGDGTGVRERYQSHRPPGTRGCPCVWSTTVPHEGREGAKGMGTDVWCRPRFQPPEQGSRPHS